MENELSFCHCGSSIPHNFTFCPRCGATAGTPMDAGFEGDDSPTRVSEPDFIAEQRIKTAKPAIARPMPPWVPMNNRAPAPRPIVTRSAPEIEAPLPRETGFRSGLYLGLGIAGFAFGVLALGTAGAGLLAIHYWQPASSVAIPVAAIAEAKPVVIAKATPRAVVVEQPKEVAVVPEATPAIVAKVEATPAPTPVAVAKVVATATPAPRVKTVAAATPRPTPAPRVVAVARPAATPRMAVATPTPAPRPSHDELLALATSARAKVAPPVAAATPVPFAEPGPDLASELVASAAAAPAKPDAELDDLLGSPSTPAPAPKKSASSRDSGERVIHARKGDKPVTVNANIAITRADGKTLVGKLVNVNGGFVDVKTSDSQLRIAESDVVDAATY